jgi:hypothetical protein
MAITSNKYDEAQCYHSCWCPPCWMRLMRYLHFSKPSKRVGTAYAFFLRHENKR